MERLDSIGSARCNGCEGLRRTGTGCTASGPSSQAECRRFEPDIPLSSKCSESLRFDEAVFVDQRPPDGRIPKRARFETAPTLGAAVAIALAPVVYGFPLQRGGREEEEAVLAPARELAAALSGAARPSIRPLTISHRAALRSCRRAVCLSQQDRRRRPGREPRGRRRPHAWRRVLRRSEDQVRIFCTQNVRHMGGVR